jgi:hypothetical protein
MFPSGRSIIQAMRNLVEDTESALCALYAVFIDYTKAPDLMNRRNLTQKLNEIISQDNTLSKIVRNILAVNYIRIDDGVTISKTLTQTNGILQGDPLKSTAIQHSNHMKKVQSACYIYADDMVIAAREKNELQRAFNKLQEWAKQNKYKYKIYKKKTVTMLFRKGGRTAVEDYREYEGDKLEMVRSFKYLGIMIQTTGFTYRQHIKDRAISAIRTMQDIKNLNLLSLNKAIKLFNAKTTLILTYGPDLIWEHLSFKNLTTLESVKATFLKKATGISKYTPSKLSYEIMKESFLIQDLRLQLLLPSTSTSEQLLNQREEK